MTRSPKRSRLEVTISWATLLKLFIAGLLAYLAFRLWRLAELLLLALLIAIAFRPLIQWTNRHRWPKWTGLLLSSLLLLGSTALFVVFLVPTIGTQGTAFIAKLPASRDQLLSLLRPSGPIRDFVNQLLSSPALSNPEPLLKYLAAWGGTVLESLVGFFVVLIVASTFSPTASASINGCLPFCPKSSARKSRWPARKLPASWATT